jgi:type IV/VI secretion system ImpK/VasF family protein
MDETRPDPQNFLDLKFTEFVIELARQKRLVRSGRWALQRVSAAPTAEGAAEGPRKANPVWRSLEQLFRRQEREARSLGLESIYEKARYPMLALADQTFLVDLKWTGQNDWNARCLEVEFTSRGIAGTEFFRKANEILERGDPTDDEVCKIYFYALKMGFRGQYQKGSQEIEDLQRALRLRFQRRKPSVRLCEEAYQHTEKGGEGVLIPSVRKTAVLVGAVLLAVIVIFAVTYYMNTSELKGILGTIEGRSEFLKRGIESGGPTEVEK